MNNQCTFGENNRKLCILVTAYNLTRTPVKNAKYANVLLKMPPPPAKQKKFCRNRNLPDRADLLLCYLSPLEAASEGGTEIHTTD